MREALRLWDQGPDGATVALAAWREALTRAEARPHLVSRTVRPLPVAGGEANWDVDGITGLLVEATVAGELRWPPLLLTSPDEQRWVQPPPLRVGAGEVRSPVPPAPVELAPLAMSPTTPEELRWLLAQPLLAGYLADILAPGAAHDLDDLLEHPACGRPGHWTTVALRRWVDAEPAFDDLDRETAENLLLSLDGLVSVAAASRDERRQALATLPAPQELPRRESACLRAWYAAAARVTGTARPFEDWLWEQSFDAGVNLMPLGYPPTFDGWASFLRRECSLPVRLGPGCYGGELAPGGARLGTADLAEVGLRLSRETDGTLLLLAIQGRQRNHVAEIGIEWENVPFDQALAELNEHLANRGQPPLALAEDLMASEFTPVTMRGRLSPMKAAELLAGLASLRLVDGRLERVPQP